MMMNIDLGDIEALQGVSNSQHVLNVQHCLESNGKGIERRER